MSSSAIFHRSPDRDYPIAVGGEGVYLFTESGEKILDGCCGAAVSCLGHSNHEVTDAIIDQVKKLNWAHTAEFTTGPAEELARLLLDESHGAFEKVCFLSSGSEAVESAIKILRQYHVYNNEPDRVNIIGRHHSYHGNTLGALAAGNNPARRPTFAPMLGPVFHHVSRCLYDADGNGRTETEYEDALIGEFEAKIAELGPSTVAGIIVEPLVGATLGSAPATASYLPRLRELCDRHGIILVFDEVMCGMGRIGSLHAWQRLGNVAPDLQTIGKGLGAGYQPLSAVLMAPKIYKLFEEHSRGGRHFESGHTFQGHPVACAGALAVQKIVKRDNLARNTLEMGELLRKLLYDGLPQEVIGHGASIRGMGLFMTVDFGTAGSHCGGRLAGEVKTETFREGAAVYPCSPTVDALLFAPPFIISAEEVAALAGAFHRALKTVLSRRREMVARK